MQEYITLKEYATKNRISIFNVMKLVRANKLEHIAKTIDGKEQIFIKASSKVEIDNKKSKEPTLQELYKEIKSLSLRLQKLESRYEECCKKKQ